MSVVTELADAFKSVFKIWFVLPPWNQAVRVRLGKHVERFEGGIHLFIPFLDQVFIQSVRLRAMHIPSQTITTSDSKTITICGSLSYRIKDILKLYQTIHQPEDTLAQHTMGILSDYMATHSLAECAPSVVCRHVNNSLSLERYGLAGVKFFLTDFAVVRTFRLIDGDLNHYQSELLHTAMASNPQSSDTSSFQ